MIKGDDDSSSGGSDDKRDPSTKETSSNSEETVSIPSNFSTSTDTVGTNKDKDDGSSSSPSSSSATVTCSKLELFDEEEPQPGTSGAYIIYLSSSSSEKTISDYLETLDDITCKIEKSRASDDSDNKEDKLEEKRSTIY